MLWNTRQLPTLRLARSAVLPARAHPADAGLDLTASEAATLPAGGHAAVGTGIAIEIPRRCVGLVVPRSGLAVDHGVTVLNAPGVIDNGYTGEVFVVLVNHGPADLEIQPGQRIAQLLVVRARHLRVREVKHLAASSRGHARFGSTG